MPLSRSVSVLDLPILVDDVPADDRFSSREIARLRSLRRPGRRTEWVLGRLLGKYLLLEASGVHGSGAGAFKPSSEAWGELPGERGIFQVSMCTPEAVATSSFEHFRQFEIIGREQDGRGAPEVWIDGKRSRDWKISLSHSAGWVACTVSRRTVGVDVEEVVPRSAAFEQFSLSASERFWVSRQVAEADMERDLLLTYLWSLKEAALKTGHVVGAAAWDVTIDPVRSPGAVPAAADAGVIAMVGEPVWIDGGPARCLSFHGENWVLSALEFVDRHAGRSEVQ